MARNCANGKIWNVLVLKLLTASDEVSQGAQARAAYDSYRWSVLGLAQQEVSDTFDVLIRVPLDTILR